MKESPNRQGGPRKTRTARRARPRNPDEVMGKLKDYMESGNYERGRQQVHADSSVVLVGNLPIRRGRPVTKYYSRFFLR